MYRSFSELATDCGIDSEPKPEPVKPAIYDFEHAAMGETVSSQEYSERAKKLGEKLYQTYSVPEWSDPYSAELLNLGLQYTHVLMQNKLIRITVPQDEYPSLPFGYSFQGGVARKALQTALGFGSPAVRDVDLVCFVGDRKEMSEALAKKYMFEDWLNCRPRSRSTLIRCYKTVQQFMQSRDLTINQVVLSDGVVFCTPQCLCDTIGGTIRATRDHRRKHHGKLSAIIACKAVRFSVELGMRLDRFKHQKIQPFDVAVHFLRAMQRSDAIALQYLKQLKRRRMFHINHDGTAVGATKSLSIDVRAKAVLQTL